MQKVTIKGYISNQWAKRLKNHGETLQIMKSLSGIPSACIISFSKTGKYTQPLVIETYFDGSALENPGINNITKYFEPNTLTFITERRKI